MAYHYRDDFFNSTSQPGRTYEEHRQHIFETTGKRMKPLNKGDSKEAKWRLISGRDLLLGASEPKKYAVKYLLPRQGIMMICAPEGIGKSKLAMNLACCLADGRPFLNKFEVEKKHRILIVDGEMTRGDNSDNLRKTALGLGIDGDQLFDLADRFDFMLATEEEGSIDISNAADQAEIKSRSRNSDIIILDSIVTLDQSGSPNFQESWLRIQPFLNQLKAAGKAIILLHHTTKSGDTLGSVKLRIPLDTLIMLKKPDDYKEEHGIRFMVNFGKHRNFSGDIAKPFEVQMVAQDGAFHWSVDGCVNSSIEDKFLDLMASGDKVGIALKKLNISASTFDKNHWPKVEERYKVRRQEGTVERIEHVEKRIEKRTNQD